MRRLLSWLALGLLSVSTSASAQEFSDVRDRDFAIDLYSGSVLGSGQIIGMAGATTAIATGSAGLTVNPAAPAVRPATSNDKWDWDAHIDWLSPQLGSDFDNNGIRAEEEFTPVFTLGAVGRYREWAIGVAGTIVELPITVPGEENLTVTPSTSIARIGVARTFLDDEITAGLALRVGSFDMKARIGDEPKELLFAISGAALETGAIWRPKSLDLRVGVSAGLPVTGENIEVESCDPLDCEGYILPSRVTVPWQVSIGGAWRFADTRWNRPVKGHFRDERYVLVAADFVVTGWVPSAHGIEAYSQKKLQPSGRNASFSTRVGAEYEWLPGRLRVRGGTYWEPNRFRDPMGRAIPGRLHITAGLDVRVWAFRFWDDPYRVRISLTGDLAKAYGNGGLSIGFWH